SKPSSANRFAATAPDAPAPTISTSGTFSAIRGSPSRFFDCGQGRPRAEKKTQRQAPDVAEVLEPAGIGPGREQTWNGPAVAIQHATVRVDSQAAEWKGDGGLQLQRVKGRMEKRFGACGAGGLER